MRGNRVPVAVEGVPYILVSGLVAIFFYFLKWYIGSIVFSLMTLFVIWFFRNPERKIPEGDNLIVAPADGKIIDINDKAECRILRKNMLKISIFMSLFNVHINRIPCSGRIVDIVYNPGKFVSANKDKASLENEQNAIVLETLKGDTMMFVQIAGIIARRIVCWLKQGEYVEKGQRFGLIRFGSRVDVYLPHDVKVMISEGDSVKGGESVLAVFK